MQHICCLHAEYMSHREPLCPIYGTYILFLPGDAEILALLPEDDIEDEIKQQGEYRESIQLALYDIEAGMKPASPRPASPRPHSPRPLEPRASPTPTTTSEGTTSNPVGTVSTVTEAVTPAATTVTTAVTTPISS